MRLHSCLAALASIAVMLPRAAPAQEQPPPRPEVAVPPPPAQLPPVPEARPASPPPAEARPAYPPPDARREYSPYPHTSPRPVPVHPPYYYPPPRPRYWWGYGWGWGWYPVYRPVAPPPPPPPGYAPAPREQERIYTRFSLYAAGRSDGYMGGLSFGLEGRYAGLDADVAALAREPVTGPLHADGSDPLVWSTAHLTWSLVNERSVRLRLETGASFLALPDSPATRDREWRGQTLVGPDLGVSGQLGLAGPVGIEGHARLTPFPTRVADTFIGLAVHGGPLGLSAGWRWVDIAGDERTAPRTMFRGPQVGLVLAF